MDGEGMQLYHAPFTSIKAAKDIDWYFKKGIEQQGLINILKWSETEFELEWQN